MTAHVIADAAEALAVGFRAVPPSGGCHGARWTACPPPDCSR